MSAVMKVHNRTFPSSYTFCLTHANLLHSYWDWSLDATPNDPNNTKVFSAAIFDPETGFGGNGAFVEATPEQNPLNITGHTGGGCVTDGPFNTSAFTVNYPKPDCLRRDFTPWILNTFADRKNVEEVLAQPDYTSFARTLEKVPTFDESNIHGSGHFGVGGVLGTIGNAANSPGGMSLLNSLLSHVSSYRTF
jgi:tyrosinase